VDRNFTVRNSCISELGGWLIEWIGVWKKMSAMSKLARNMSIPTHDEIAAQAYQIYLRNGAVAGRDLENWLEAETELMSARERDSASADTRINGASPLSVAREGTPPQTMVAGVAPRANGASKRATRRQA
jgi:hypothetical protein